MKQHFAGIVPDNAIVDSQAERDRYGRDWIKDYTPNASLVLFPSTSEEVKKIVLVCNQNKIAIVPSGGRTGLSGGATARNAEVIVSLERLNKIFSVTPSDRTLVCGAGTITQKVQEEAVKHGLYFPVDFASKGSSHVGGNASTNAGGIRVIKYGNFRDWVLGLKVVTAAGDLLEINGPLYKNQTGYDLRGLFLGSEGTLGIITELTLKLTQLPGEVSRVLVGVEKLDAVLPLLVAIRAHNPQVSAFEFFFRNALDKVLKLHTLPEPLEQKFPYYILIEVERMSAASQNALEEFMFEQLESGKVSGVAISQNSKQAEQFLAYRELISESLSKLHTLHKNDISVPISSIPAFIEELNQLMPSAYPDYEMVIFGHIGDGNLHLNVTKPDGVETPAFFKHCKAADHKVFALVQRFRGSISAEHGVGILKKEFLRYSRTEAEISLMKQIKKVFDPNAVLNPGKIFDVD